MRGGTIYVLLSCFALSALASGQEFPKAEVFGGYSYLHIDTQGVSGSSLTQFCTTVIGGTCPVTFGIHPGFSGFEVSGQYNVNHWLGVKADFSGHYGNVITVKLNPQSTPILIPFSFSSPGQHVYDFLFGPVVSHRTSQYTVFAHALLGAEHAGLASGSIPVGLIPGSFSPAFSETDFAVALGGGFDYRLNRRFSIRIGQFDYQRVSSSGNGSPHQNDFRFSAGVVFGFGGR